jgi:hypothetical protein
MTMDVTAAVHVLTLVPWAAREQRETLFVVMHPRCQYKHSYSYCHTGVNGCDNNSSTAYLGSSDRGRTNYSKPIDVCAAQGVKASTRTVLS